MWLSRATTASMFHEDNTHMHMEEPQQEGKSASAAPAIDFRFVIFFYTFLNANSIAGGSIFVMISLILSRDSTEIILS